MVEVNFENTVKMDAWKLYHYDAYFSGDDHGEEWNEEKKALQEVGSDLVFFPYTKETSSTKIKKQLKEEEIPRYKRKLDDCLDVVEKTEELNTQDYFLINEKVVNRAVEKYGGVITRTGRGSGGAFYLNRVLGLTQLDSETTSIPIYPERFMSTARILENHSFPDIDLNVAQQEPFIRATKDVLGEYSCYQMVAYGTMQLGEAFRNYCRSLNLEYKEYNEVAKNLERYRDDPKWSSIIEEC